MFDWECLHGRGVYRGREVGASLARRKEGLEERREEEERIEVVREGCVFFFLSISLTFVAAKMRGLNEWAQ